MPIDKQDALQHLGSVLEAYGRSRESDGYTDYISEPSFIRTRLRNALKRLAPPGSEHEEAMTTELVGEQEIGHLAQVAKALQQDYIGGYLNTFQEIFNAELFSDFLKMAEHLLREEKLRQPAAVIAGGVLEEHLRNLCTKHGVSVTTNTSGTDRPKKLDVINAELRKTGLYGPNDQKQVTAWCGIRNSAAHAKYEEFDATQVANLIDGIRSFIARYPA